MKETKNTDELIRAKLENYSVTPPPHVWQQVQQQLAAQNRRTRMIWFRVAAVAAVVVFAFMAGWYFNDNIEKSLVTSVNTEIENKTTQQNNSTLTGQSVIAETINKEIKITKNSEFRDNPKNKNTIRNIIAVNNSTIGY